MKYLVNVSFEGSSGHSTSLPAVSVSKCAAFCDAVFGGHKYDIFESDPLESSSDTTTANGILVFAVLKEHDTQGLVKRSKNINFLAKSTFTEDDMKTLLLGKTFDSFKVDDIFYQAKFAKLM